MTHANVRRMPTLGKTHLEATLEDQHVDDKTETMRSKTLVADLTRTCLQDQGLGTN